MSSVMRKTGATVLAESLDVSDACYEQAAARYEDIGKWLSDRSTSACAQFKPHIFAQGSFRLGLVTKPIAGEDYDLDLACTLQEGISPSTHSQKSLKQLVGGDLELYRKARKFQEPLEEKHRCWRLNYQDHVNFHIDTVPSVPFDHAIRRQLRERMVKAGLADSLAHGISEAALAITDNRHPSYSLVAPDWTVSNPEGYAVWFESRMRQAAALLESRAQFFKVASIEKLPTYRWRTPLQQALQMLKRHRDMLFRERMERKPISIIITTLAAHAYQGENDLQATLTRLLADMDKFISRSNPRVPNPVNPAEDFADKWAMPEGRALQLEQNFHTWLTQARADFGHITNATDKAFFDEQSRKKFGIRIEESILTSLFGASPQRQAPVIHRIQEAPKPWATR